MARETYAFCHRSFSFPTNHFCHPLVFWQFPIVHKPLELRFGCLDHAPLTVVMVSPLCTPIPANTTRNYSDAHRSDVSTHLPYSHASNDGTQVGSATQPMHSQAAVCASSPKQNINMLAQWNARWGFFFIFACTSNRLLIRNSQQGSPQGVQFCLQVEHYFLLWLP